jgi:hypothetical protein
VVESRKVQESNHSTRQELFTVRLYFIVLTTLCLLWRSVEAEDYKYPFRDPYIATVTAAILNGDGLTPKPKRQVVHVPGLPGRNHLPALEGRGDVSVAVYRQDHPAPLLFILSGIGSNAYFGPATYFAGLFYQEGFHVVILPSPMSWNFALAASRSGAPGYAPEDARDLYEAMQNTLWLLRTRYHVATTRIDFLGASLGALEGAYLSVIDAEERKIGIDTYLLLNPPLDLTYALDKVDEWTALQNTFGRDKCKRLVGKALAIVESFSQKRLDDPAVFDRLAKQFASFSTEEIKFLIAAALQTSLPELVYVTQGIHDQRAPAPTNDEARKRIRAAKNMTFKDYGERIALPWWKQQAAADHQGDLESFAGRGSLAPILDRLRGNAKVHIVHNADDVLVDRASIEELKAALGDQMTVFPYGGHLGNLWYSENKEFAVRLFKTAPRTRQTARGVTSEDVAHGGAGR